MTYTYKLTNGKNKGLVQLATKGMTAIKEVTLPDGSTDKREKPIQYVKGANSIFVEDHEKTAKVGKVWFEDGYLTVSSTDWALNEFIKNTKRYGIDYVLVDEERDSAKKLEDKKKRHEVENAIINENDLNKLRAMAIVLIGTEARNWQENVCKTQLLEFADKKLQAVIQEQQKPGYESRLLAAEAYVAGIVKDNATHTEIVWGDGNGVILRLAQGENGIDKLGNFFADGSDAAVLVMQEIGERAERKVKQVAEIKAGIATQAPVKSEAEIRAEVEAKLQAEFDRKFEELKQQLTQSAPVNTAPAPSQTPCDEYNPADLSSVREEYRKVVGNIPPNKNNDIEWLVAKIEATKATA